MKHISIKIYNILIDYGITNSGVFVTMSDKDLLEIDGIGVVTLKQLRALRDEILDDFSKLSDQDIASVHMLLPTEIKQIRTILRKREEDSV